MPEHDGLGPDDLDGASPVRPQPRQQDPQQAIGATKPGSPRHLALKYGELMPEREDLGLEFEPRPSEGPEGGEQGDQQRRHAPADGIGLGP
jgi:hypothetical protein